MSKQVNGISREAAQYAIRELGRRAGVAAADLRRWRVVPDNGQTIVYVQADSEKRIVFPAAKPQFWQELSEGKVNTVRYGWMAPPAAPLSNAVPDFIVPYAENASGEIRPLFYAAGPDAVHCLVDLPVSAWLTLSRFEENQAAGRDEHGRFIPAASLAGRLGFLERPIVDEYGLALEQALEFLMPAWKGRPRKLRVKLSHDCDVVGLPFSPKATLGHLLVRGAPAALWEDLRGAVTSRLPAYLRMVVDICKMSLERGLDSALYWKASRRTPYDSGYDLGHPKVREVIRWAEAQGIEMGVHPAYDTFEAPEELKREVRRAREVLGNRPMGGRQHFLRWSPEQWEHWEKCGLAYDSTVGYARQVGFRAGTCIPYRPWSLRLNRELNLLEIPLIVMDGTLVEHRKLRLEESIETVNRLVSRVEMVGGVFTLLWHNSSLIGAGYNELYTPLLDRLPGASRYDWAEDFRELCAG